MISPLNGNNSGPEVGFWDAWAPLEEVAECGPSETAVIT